MRKLFIVFTLALLFATACNEQRASESTHLYIVATNDIHANIYALPQLKTLVDEYDKLGEVLLVDAGDRVSGNAFIDDGDSPYIPMIELMNAIGYDVVTLGNHEFDKGAATLGEMVAMADFDTVCANVVSRDGSVEFEEYVIKEVAGAKIGFVGVVDTDEQGHPLGDDAVYADFIFTNDVDTAYAMCDKIADECDYVVLLSHMGDNIDESFIARSPRCHWVAGGHTHEVRNDVIRGVQLTQSGKSMARVMVADLEICDGEVVSTSFSHVAVDDYVANADIVDVVADIKSRNPELNTVEGYAEAQFTHNGVANFTVEALRCYPYADKFVPDVVFYHFGGVRLSAILPGEITRGDIYNNDPFNSVIMIGALTGGQMREFIMRKYNSVGEGGRKDKESHYPYFRSNVPYEIVVNTSGDADDVRFELEDDKMYSVAVCDYITKKYIDADVVAAQFKPAGVSVREAMLKYVRSFNGAPLNPDNVLHQREVRAEN